MKTAIAISRALLVLCALGFVYVTFAFEAAEAAAKTECMVTVQFHPTGCGGKNGKSSPGQKTNSKSFIPSSASQKSNAGISPTGGATQVQRKR
jgi:hypothetical protein